MTTTIRGVAITLSLLLIFSQVRPDSSAAVDTWLYSGLFKGLALFAVAFAITIATAVALSRVEGPSANG